MGFEKFGTVSFTTEAKPVEFVDNLEQGKVMTTRCKQCGRTFFPPKTDCPSCLNSEVEWVEITGSGQLRTYAIISYGPTGFENDAPYTLAIADFADGLRVFGRLSRDINEDDMKVGMVVKVAPVRLGDDRVSYEFQKA